MDETLAPIINVIPEKWHNTAILVFLLSPYITRGVHALMSGRGLRGVFSSIWFGTNIPKEKEKTNEES